MYLSEGERQLLLKLIDGQMVTLSGRYASRLYRELMELRPKIAGADKHLKVEG
jgi:hypothetical protein